MAYLHETINKELATNLEYSKPKFMGDTGNGAPGKAPQTRTDESIIVLFTGGGRDIHRRAPEARLAA